MILNKLFYCALSFAIVSPVLAQNDSLKKMYQEKALHLQII